MQVSRQRFRALLVGVLAPGFATDRALRRLKKHLLTMFPNASPDDVETMTRACGRKALCERLDAWVDDTRAGDVCLFYYFGHGGRAKFPHLTTEGAAERIVPYLTCDDDPGGEVFSGLLDRELSIWMSEIDRRCANVTVIIDSCYSGTVVRAQTKPETGAEGERLDVREATTLRVFRRVPDVVRKLLEAEPHAALAVESHPRVVRLTGASPRREAHPNESALDTHNRGLGIFTVALLHVLKIAGNDWTLMTWDILAHAVREQVISANRMEGQWVSLAGPSDRLLFSTQRARLPRVVGYRAAADGHWIRAGSLMGVEVGDRWGLADPFVDEERCHRPVVIGSVEAVELNRARIVLDEPASGSSALGILAPSAAFVKRVARPVPVWIDPVNLARCPNLHVGDTAWLCPGKAPSRNRVVRIEDRLELVDAIGEWAPVRFDPDDEGRAGLLELLEDRARATRLLESLERLASQRRQRSPIRWRASANGVELKPGSELRSGAELRVRLDHTDKGGPHWFTSVVLIDAIGRPWLLNASSLDGVELEPSDSEIIGLRPGAVQGGVVVDWPSQAVGQSPAQVRILTISCGRPIQLGHLTRALPSFEPDAFCMQGLNPICRNDPEQLDKAPDPTCDWGFGSLELQMYALAD